ncbi:mucin-2-like [Brachyistius frenatus]|uniref:mucin-2-like n=1 Tax=Brachyistius frenatus TaxID=100188 RepID=UPI0037E71402
MSWRSTWLCFLALSIASVIEVQGRLVRNHVSSICSTWGREHFKTFDGDVYQFSGMCEYNLASDCHETYQEFAVHMKREDDDGNPTVSYVVVNINDLSFHLSKSLVTVNDVPVTMPYYQAGVTVEKNAVYIKLQSKVGITVMWNSDDAVMVEIDNEYANRTCGLCGDFNGVPVYNEFILHGRKINPIEFGNKQKVHRPNDDCEDPYEEEEGSLEAVNVPDSCKEFQTTCNQMLRSESWSSCTKLINPEPYIQACVQDMCGCTNSTNDFCICSTLSEFSRQCSHAGGNPPSWRTPQFCAKQCPFNMVYEESGSPCLDSCTHQDTSSLCEDHTIDGCFCPPGTVFDDISMRGCVAQSDCQCKHDKIYNSGEIYRQEREECTCFKGRWACESLQTPATCAVEEGSHVTTFDAKTYTFHGDCYYTLVKDDASPKFTILAQLVPCANQELDTCLKTLKILLNNDRNNVLMFTSDGTVKQNTQTISLPYYSGDISIFHASSFHILLQTSFGLRIQIQHVPIMQVYISLEQSYRAKTRGLCGNYNMVLSDDMKTPQGIVEGTSATFSNSWKANLMCQNREERLDDPCSLSVENERYAKHWCALLLSPNSTFTQCRSVVDPELYYKRCTYASCNCEKSEACLCAVFSSYARACASKGVFLTDWRENVCDKYTKNCPASQTFSYKHQRCQLTCGSLGSKQQSCTSDFLPVDGCSCSEGLYLNEKGTCVSMAKCPCYHNEVYIKPGKSINIKDEHWTPQSVNLAAGVLMASLMMAKVPNKCGNKTVQDNFGVSTENVPCGSTGTTCSKSVRIQLGKMEIKLSKGTYNVEDLGDGPEIQYKIRKVGLYVVVESAIGLAVMWDRKTTVRILLEPQHSGEVCGLCGNFDGDGQNDFTTRSQLVVSSPLEFANSWKVSSTCPDVETNVDPCEATPNRHHWAKMMCSIITGHTFQECHSKVDPRPFHENCVKDSCACDTGGDCECFCTAVAAYAQACNEAGVCVAWRTPEICRCYPICPEDKPIFDERNNTCVEICDGCLYNGTLYNEYDVIYNVTDNLGMCYYAICINATVINGNEPCSVTTTPSPTPTTAEPTTTTKITTPTPRPPTTTAEPTTTPTPPQPPTTTAEPTTTTKVTTPTTKPPTTTAEPTTTPTPEPPTTTTEPTTTTKVTTPTPQPPTTTAEPTTTPTPEPPTTTAEPTTTTKVPTPTTKPPTTTAVPTATTKVTTPTTKPSHTTAEPSTTPTPEPPTTTAEPTTTTKVTTPTTMPSHTTAEPTTTTKVTTPTTKPPTTTAEPTTTTKVTTPTTKPPTTTAEPTTTPTPEPPTTTAEPTTTTKVTTPTTKPPTTTAEPTTTPTPEPPTTTAEPTTTTKVTTPTTMPSHTTAEPTTTTKVTTPTTKPPTTTAEPTTTTKVTTPTTKPPTTTAEPTTTPTPEPPTTTAEPTTTTKVTTLSTKPPITTAEPTTTTKVTTPTTKPPTTTAEPTTTTKVTTPTTKPPTTTAEPTTTPTPEPPTTTAEPTTTTKVTTLSTKPPITTAELTTTTKVTTPTTKPPTTTAESTTTPTPEPPTTTAEPTTTTKVTTLSTKPPITTAEPTTTTKVTTPTTMPSHTTAEPTTTTKVTTPTTKPPTTTAEPTTTPTPKPPTTTAEPTTTTKAMTTTTSVTTPCIPTCEWSDWYDVHDPKKDQNDWETYKNITNSGKEICENPLEIDCRSADYPNKTLNDFVSETGQVVTCDVEYGFICKKEDQLRPPKKCFNYKIRVCCDICSPTTPTTSPTTTAEPTTTPTPKPPTTTAEPTTTTKVTTPTTKPPTTTAEPTTTTKVTTPTTKPPTTTAEPTTTPTSEPPTTTAEPTTTTKVTTPTTKAPTTTAEPTTTPTPEPPTTTAEPTTTTKVTTPTPEPPTTTAEPTTTTKVTTPTNTTTAEPTTTKVTTPTTKPPTTTAEPTTTPTPEPPTTTAEPTTTTKTETCPTTPTPKPTPKPTPPVPTCPEWDVSANETFFLCNCTMARCIENNTIEIVPYECPPIQNITCTNGKKPVLVYDEYYCCQHYACDCVCEGWGDPHYITFDGFYYSYQGNCTYVLMEEITTTHNLKIYIDNVFCDPTEDVSCPRSIIISYNSQVVTLKNHNLIGAAQLEALKGGVSLKLPYSQQGVKIINSGLNLVLEILRLEVVITFGITGFSVTLPFQYFGRNTQGHCGTCNNNQADDCMLPGGELVESCAVMADYWPANDISQPNCPIPPVLPTNVPEPPPTLTPCNPDSLCSLLYSSLFAVCHPFVSPENFYKGCAFDSCHVSNPAVECTSLQTYAAACAQAGVCIHWRNHTTLCASECPSNKVYKPCGPTDQATCEDNPNDPTMNFTTEGCFCPDGMKLFNKDSEICVEKCGCLDPEGIPREFNERFEYKCQDCICDKSTKTVICKPRVCPAPPIANCTGDGFVLVNQSNPSDPCCSAFVCQCQISSCPVFNMNCPVGYKSVIRVPEGKCCPEHTCEPKRVCVHKNVEYQPASSVPVQECQECTCTNEVDPKSGLFKITCQFQQCDENCEMGYEYVEGDYDECCGKCVQTHCVLNVNGTKQLLMQGETWSPPGNKCEHYSCVKSGETLTMASSQIVCPPFQQSNCQRDTIQTAANGCCKICVEKEKACKLVPMKTHVIYKTCQSDREVDMPYCEGSCNTFTKYSQVAAAMQHSCSCCKETRFTNRTVELLCLNGDLVPYTYMHVEECGCGHTDCTRDPGQPARRKRSFKLL